MKKAFDLKAIFHPVQLTLGSCWKTILLFSLLIPSLICIRLG